MTWSFGARRQRRLLRVRLRYLLALCCWEGYRLGRDRTMAKVEKLAAQLEKAYLSLEQVLEEKRKAELSQSTTAAPPESRVP